MKSTKIKIITCVIAVAFVAVSMVTALADDQSTSMVKPDFKAGILIQLERMAEEEGITVEELIAQMRDEFEDKAEELGITVEELKEKMRQEQPGTGFGRHGFNGKEFKGDPETMNERLEKLAEEKGITVDELREQMQEEREKAINARLEKMAEGKGITVDELLQEMAAEKGITVDELMEQLLNGQNGLRPGFHGAGRLDLEI